MKAQHQLNRSYSDDLALLQREILQGHFSIFGGLQRSDHRISSAIDG